MLLVVELISAGIIIISQFIMWCCIFAIHNYKSARHSTGSVLGANITLYFEIAWLATLGYSEQHCSW